MSEARSRAVVEFRFGALYGCARCVERGAGGRNCVELRMDHYGDYLLCLACGCVSYPDQLPVETRIAVVGGCA